MDESQKQWYEDVISDIFNARDRGLIRKIPLPQVNRDDTWFWPLEEKGKFTVRSCYRHIQGEQVFTERNFWRKMWSLNLPGKVTNFLWRACRDCLPTAEALHAKRVNINLGCTWCQSGLEDAVHVLFRSEFAQEIWSGTGFESILTVLPQDTVKTILQRVFSTKSKDQCAMVGLMCWGLWYRRNQWVWEHVNKSVFGLKAMVFNMLTDWKRVKEASAKTISHQQLGDRLWSKPPTGWVKINIDAACNQSSGLAGMGCVIRDSQGQFLRARCNALEGDIQPRIAEALSLQEAVIWTSKWQYTRCNFESDSKLLVDAVNGSIGNSYFDTIAANCKELIKHFEEVSVVFVHRSANTVAHFLAKATYSELGLQEWHHTAPDFIACTLDSEKV